MKKLFSIGGLAVLVVLFFAVNIWSNAGLKGVRADLTQAKLFTLSPGAKRIAASPAEPVTLYFYYSGKLAQGSPSIQSYAQRVRELLEEFELRSGGKINLRVIDPEPFSDDEDRAVQAGLAPVPMGPSENLYLGLVGTNTLDSQEVIPFFDSRQERFLEYDISKLIYVLAHPKKKVIGLMSSLQMEGMMFDPMTGQPTRQPPWQIVREMRSFFEVKTIPPDTDAIPADLDALMVVHPKNLSERAQYAIDQYVLRGGRLLLFLDPFCEGDQPPGMNPMEAMGVKRDSYLPKLLGAWGIELVEQRVAGDLKSAIPVVVGAQNRPEQVSFVAWLSIKNDTMNRDDSVMAQVSQMNFASPGILQNKEGGPMELTPLVQTSDQSQMLDVAQFVLMPDPKAMLRDFKPSGEKRTLAARLKLKDGAVLKTAFPEGKPAAPGPDGAAKAPEAAADQLKEASAAPNIVVVSDVDVLTDRFWTREERLFGQSLGYSKIADNGDFVINVLDNLSGSSDLISIRARGEYARPFTRVQDMLKSAEQKYLAKQQDLEKRLQDTEQKIAELQRKRPDQPGKDTLILSPEQQAEIEKFRSDMIGTRKELRNVQLDLRKDVERLGVRLKFLNIAAVPLVVSALALGLGAYRVARRKSGQKLSRTG
ncbi:MAG: Gldg family protein [Phycisphaerales bacterium]|nr:Gldg family protein [Phycisphaerales bacterium]